jgi:hypothetical protein
MHSIHSPVPPAAFMVMGVDHAAVYPTRRAETVRENFMMLLIDYVQ